MIKEYDKVRLETGEIARVVEVLEADQMFIAEIFKKFGGIEVEHVQYDDIASVFEEIEHPLKRNA